MITSGHLLLQDCRLMLHREISRQVGKRDLDEALSAWLLAETAYGPDIQSCASEATSRLAGARSYRDVATLGYAVASGLVSGNESGHFSDAMNWLLGRTHQINGHPAGFCSDGASLLGLSLGAAAIGGDLKKRTADWLSNFIEQGMAGRGVAPWQLPLFTAAAYLVDAVIRQPISMLPDFADIRVALRARNALPPTEADQVTRDEVDTIRLTRGVDSTVIGIRASFREAAISWVARSAPILTGERSDWTTLAALLRRIPAGLRRWTWEEKPRTKGRDAMARQWHIDNEYHVQNLLYFALAPVYPDLLDELVLEPFGQLHPRADLCIPSLKTVVEVKFIRMGASFAKVIEEVASDAIVYFGRRDLYDGIVVFLWDDSVRIQEHDLVRQGLLKIPGVLDAIIVPRPGSFVRTSNSLGSSTNVPSLEGGIVGTDKPSSE